MGTTRSIETLLSPVLELCDAEDAAMAERSGARAAWRGFRGDGYDEVAAAARAAGATLVSDLGVWPHWAFHVANFGDVGVVAVEYCEGDVGVFVFDDGDALTAAFSDAAAAAAAA